MLAGFGLVLANWASLAVLVVIPVLGHLPRIAVEDALLIDRLGEPYRGYSATTARAARLVVDSKAEWVPAQ